MSDTSRKRLGWFLFALFALAMIMGPGPGATLDFVNQPEPSFFGLPRLYIWGIAWYFVQAFVVVTAYLFVWRDPENGEKESTR